MRLQETTKGLLIFLATAGILAVAVTSPYFLINLAQRYLKERNIPPEKKRARNVAQALASAKRSKLIILREEDGKLIVELSERGRRKIKGLEFQDLKIPTPQKWDKKWRLVIFDIPETKKGKLARQALVEKLRLLGFILLQKSVWAHPYPCEKEVRLVAENFGVSRFIHIVVAESISNDAKLYSRFSL
jgi:DNA-binding transcriptional regulator PaaX